MSENQIQPVDPGQQAAGILARLPEDPDLWSSTEAGEVEQKVGLLDGLIDHATSAGWVHGAAARGR
jgi:hypothetical protein